MSEELKPRPFCGSNQIVDGTARDNTGVVPMTVWLVKCTVCGSLKNSISNRSRAIKRWNTRPAEDALKAEITRYRRAFHNLKEDCTRRKHFAVSDEEKLFLYETISHIEAELDFNTDTGKGGEDEP